MRRRQRHRRRRRRFDDTLSGRRRLLLRARDDGVRPVRESAGAMITYDATAPSGTVSVAVTARTVVGDRRTHRRPTTPAARRRHGRVPALADGRRHVDDRSTPTALVRRTPATLDTTGLVDGDVLRASARRHRPRGQQRSRRAVATILVVDNSAPTVAMTAPVAASRTCAARIASSANAADVGSGVASVRSRARRTARERATTFDTDSSGPGPYTRQPRHDDARRGRRVRPARAGDRRRGQHHGQRDRRERARGQHAADRLDLRSAVASTFVHGTVVTNATATDGAGSGVASVQFQWSPHGTASWTTYRLRQLGPESVHGKSRHACRAATGPTTCGCSSPTSWATRPGECGRDERARRQHAAERDAHARRRRPRRRAVPSLTSASVADGSGSGVGSVAVPAVADAARVVDDIATDSSDAEPLHGHARHDGARRRRALRPPRAS